MFLPSIYMEGMGSMISIEDPAFKRKEPECTKRPYATKSDAALTIKKSELGGVPYYCNQCDIWHIQRPKKGK